MKREDINIRDPFILPYEGKYYLYGSRGSEVWEDNATGLDVYVSEDLENWSEPKEIFTRTADFWADRHYWAPEVYAYNGAFYMFASFKSADRCRGTMVLKADKPDGKFTVHSEGTITPPDWESLDGTLYISKSGKPYMIFCHEWVQVNDGEMCAIEMSADLKRAVGEPILLFKASEASWIAEAQKNGGIAAFIDADHAFDRFYAEKLGVDVENLWISQPDNGEQALEIAEQLIRSSAVDIIVIDSVAALTPKAEIEGDMGDSKMGLQARLMSQALRKLTAAINKTNTTCIFINQLRDKIGVMFGNPETTTGGNALKFYASVRLDIRSIGKLKDGDDIKGNQVRVKVVKNKVAPPFRKAEFDIMFGEGISKAGEIIDLGAELNIIKKSGSLYSYNDTKLGQGRDAAKQCVADNPELADELSDLIFEALKG